MGCLVPIFASWNNNRSVFARRRIDTVALNDKVNRQIQRRHILLRLWNSVILLLSSLIRCKDSIISTSHQLLLGSWCAVDVCAKEFNHVFFGIAGGVGASHSVLWDKKLLVVVEELHDHVWWWAIDDG